MKLAIGVSLLLAAWAWAMWLAFTNIDMTAQRLVVTFWPSYIAIAIMTAEGKALVK